MALAIWPATLPQAPLLDFEAAPRAGTLDPEEARHPMRTRTYPEHEATFHFVMTMAQWATFCAFYEDALNGGCAPFAAPWLPDIQYTHHFLRFVEPPTDQTYNRRHTKVTIKVEVIAGVPLVDGSPALWTGGE
ncbi:hypothetical protein [Megalodesulfovibrio gigas]|uniref:Uncharacterized protein n=1 Tax=Megalodesulfovibrio gigas (strain ATCC 19364 / DSM 1382 / NCIMB 9332 / VKM B-1759) TaxID=1121448 RepID=T2GB46_MEGG1|nr:hypothetical protein [Megalodesulfovibrio gigas]AGW13810.1 hypothetical protein DGI_2041 [Megalodesulfovibrio gigas DSM 1382 = ATCC 19364]